MKLKQMNDRDILLQICSKMDNSSLEKMSQTYLWEIIREFIQDEYFWYLRTQHLVSRELKPRIGDWKTVYYHLLDSITYQVDPFTRHVASDKLSVEVLLEMGYNPSVNNNWPLRYTLYNRNIEVAKLLLSDSRVDPSSNNDSVIIEVYNYRNAEALKLLLEDGRVDPSLGGSCRFHIENEEVTRLLLEDGRADPRMNNNYAIKKASELGRTRIVELLLEDGRADPSSEDNYSIRFSSENGYTEVVRLLLQDKRVDPSARDNYAMQAAMKYNHHEIVKLLE